MGLLDTELMETLQKELDGRYGAGEKLVYGEPWRAGDTAAKNVTLCDKNALKKINGRIGAFCDDTRDAVKGSVMDAQSVGFVNGGTITPEILKKCVAGWAGEYGAFQTPAQTITYLSCHDDWTLWDKLVYTMGPDKNFTGNDPFIRRINRLAAAICFSCQGRLFIHAGEEFGRTKGGIKNSYCSSADTNRLDWERAWENRDLVDYYRGLIALRKQLPGLQDKTEAAFQRILRSTDVAHNCAAVLLDNRGENSRWQQLYLCFNCGMEDRVLTLPDGSWQILADGEDAFLWEKEIRIAGRTVIPAKSALLLGK
jgi:pullulanase